MKRLYYSIALLLACVTLVGNLNAQVKDYDVTPDFDYNDYSSSMQYMIQPFALTGQTLYLSHVNDTLLDYFYTGMRASEYEKQKISKKNSKDKGTNDNRRYVSTKNGASGVTADNTVRFHGENISYYQLTRMSKEKLKSLEGAWFVVLDYVPDQFAFNRIYKAVEGKRDWTKLRHPFLKLLVGNTTDTVFYEYQNFYNQYHFPFTPMSYYNSNKNGYPVSKYSYDDLNLIAYDTNANYAIVPDQLIGKRITLPVVTDATYERLFNGIKLYNYSDDSRKYSFTDYPIAKAKRLEGQSFIVKDIAFDLLD